MVIGLFQGYAHVFPQVRLITEAPDGEGEEHSQARVPPQDEGERVSVEGNRGAEEGFEEGKRVQSSTEIESTFVVVCRALTSFKVALASFGPRGTNLNSGCIRTNLTQQKQYSPLKLSHPPGPPH